ncbi:MAG: hypothetical protein ACK5P6_06860 [Pseudobdellovibrionaceae bacterium]
MSTLFLLLLGLNAPSQGETKCPFQLLPPRIHLKLSKIEKLELKDCSPQSLYARARESSEFVAAQKCAALHESNFVYTATSFVLGEMAEKELASFLCSNTQQRIDLDALTAALKKQREELQEKMSLTENLTCKDLLLAQMIEPFCQYSEVDKSMEELESANKALVKLWLPHQVSQFRKWKEAFKHYSSLRVQAIIPTDTRDLQEEAQKVLSSLKNEDLRAQKESLDMAFASLDKIYLETLSLSPSEREKEALRVEQRAWRKYYEELDLFLQNLKLNSLQAHYLKMILTEDRLLRVKALNTRVKNPSP